MVQIELISRQLLHYANTPGYPPDAANWLIRLLLTELDREDIPESAFGARICAAVCHWIKLNCDLPIKPKQVSAHFNYNSDYLNRIFKSVKHCTIKEYIDKEKLKKIKKVLSEGEVSLAKISENFGFTDYKYFLKYFKYHEGISPSEYKRVYYNTEVNNS